MKTLRYILFLLIDTLRASRMGSYGYERDTSPVLDQLAAEGARFDRHLAQSSWTKCSMASLWTGLQPPRVGVTKMNSGIPEDAVMPAEIPEFRSSDVPEEQARQRSIPGTRAL